MSVDPRDPATFEEVLEDEDEEFDVEAPRADAAEQHTDVLESHDAPVNPSDLGSANPADAVEQARVVEVNEDEYR